MHGLGKPMVMETAEESIDGGDELGVKPWSGLWVSRAFECSCLVIADYGGELR